MMIFPNRILIIEWGMVQLMDKSLKRKIFMFSALIGAMLFYLIFFGRKNIAVGVMIIIAAFMNLNDDLSYKPGLSFVKVLGLLLIMGIVSYLNNPITIVGCILTFLVVFGTTFSSYHLFRSDVYMPYLLCYFIMSANPVSLENLPASSWHWLVEQYSSLA